MTQPFRLPPKMPTGFYKTYKIASPVNTHFRVATCAEVKCKAYLEGWTYRKSDLESENLLYTVTHAGKRWREMKLDDSPETYIVFEPGQVCFQASTHRITLERPEFFLAGRGDYRSFNPRKATRFANAEEWVDSFATHQDILNSITKEG